MQISSNWTATLGPPAAAALNLLGRLATVGQPSVIGTPVGTLTAAAIRAVLLELGVAAADGDVALAMALTQTGLPLTVGSLAEARSALASAPGTTPESYALAKSLALPTTPHGLKAMTAVLEAASSPGAGALPEKVTAWLGLGLDAGTPPEALARGMREMLLHVGRSTEHRLLTLEAGQLPTGDLRTALLRLAGASRDRTLRHGADGLASLIEGQQLLNQAALTARTNMLETPLYFALPMAFDTQAGIAELRVWLPNECSDEEDEDAAALKVTLRLSPPKLGRVQVELTGKTMGVLNCRLGAEKLAAVRLLSRHTGALAAALSDAGWPACDVVCRSQVDWPPLHHGGETFTAPRPCVDRHI